MAFLRTVLKCSLSRKYGINFSNSLQNGRINVNQLALRSSSSSPSTGSANESPKDPLDVTFENARAAFKSKTTWELYRAYLVYTICSFEYIVEHNMKGCDCEYVECKMQCVVQKVCGVRIHGQRGWGTHDYAFKIMKVFQTLMGEKLFGMVMKATFYGHFVAGEDQYKIRPCLERLRSFGVKPILDYSVEEDLTQEEAEKREVEASVSEVGDNMAEGAMKQYHVDKTFADRRYKVQSARTYFYLNEAQCEKNMEIFTRCLEAVAEYDKKSAQQNKDFNHSATFGTGITAVKLTALGRPQLLLQLSEVIMRTRQFMSELDGGTGNVLGHHLKAEDLEKKLIEKKIDASAARQFLQRVTTDKEGVLHLFPWSGILDENYQLNETFKVPDLKTGKMVGLLNQLTTKEEEMFRNMIRRLNTICKLAQEMDVRIMVDAEQTYFQPAISRITLEMMRKYNKEKAIVFNTYQCYLQNTFNEVQTDLEQAKRQDFYFAAKLVRGAYIDQERARAAALGYPDPTNPDFDATSEMYHKTLSECLRRIKAFKNKGQDKKIGIMVASHNEDTVRFAIKQMEEIGISPEDKVICFGQLLGMCDYITFPLGQSGYSAYKYIPYGPVNEVLPYLSRRAMENKGVLKKIKKEKRLLLSEIIRRTATLQFFYKPKGNYTPV